jgi:hypothetical protein
VSQFPFRHDGRVYLAVGDEQVTAYYSRNKRKYKRVKLLGHQYWENTTEQAIDDDHFWMVVACIERKPRYA